MKVAETFDVAASVETVWNLFQDVPLVAACLPGAELTGREADGSYRGCVKVRLGPMESTFEGTATITPDLISRSGRIVGTGIDRRGGSRGRVEVNYTVAPVALGTRVAIEADINLSGAAAQFGRPGIIMEVARRLVGEFADCLAATLGPAGRRSGGPAPIKGGRLFLAALWGAVAGFLRRLFRGG